MLNRAEQELMQKLRKKSANFDSFESYFEHADAPIVASLSGDQKSQTSVMESKGNPAFTAQFDTQIFIKYYTLNGGVYTPIAPAALNPALKNKLPVFLFGNADYAAGFTKMKAQYPLVNWVYGTPGTFGRDYFTPYAFDANVLADLQGGDMVMPFTSPLPGAGTTTLALVIVRCTQVAYASLLESISSDRFVMNMIRYVLPDLTQLAQYSQQLGVYYQSLFGKFDSDTLSPNSYKKPEQLQNGIIDIPLKRGIAKQDCLASYLIYTNVETDLSFFVYSVDKVTN
jgi:hypothetical protein